MKKLAAWIGCVSVWACADSEGTIQLRFANEVAQRSLRRLTIEVFDPLAGRDCNGLLGTAADREDPERSPTLRGEFNCASDDQTPCSPEWIRSVELEGLRRGVSTIYLRGYASVAEDAPVIFEGCTDRFDTDDASSDVPVPMSFVLPDTARIVHVSGPGQVATEPGPAPRPWVVRVLVTDPRGGGGARGDHVLPGFPVRFERSSSLGQLRDPSSGAVGEALEVVAGSDGTASILLQLPGGTGTVEARVDADWARVGNGPSRDPVQRPEPLVGRFSVVEPVRFEGRASADGIQGRAAALDVGDFDHDGSLDAAVLSCTGSGRCEFSEDLSVEAELGRSTLTLVRGVSFEPQVDPAQVADDDLPVDAVTVNYEGEDHLVVAHLRQGDCRPVACPRERLCRCEDGMGRPCSCEASVIEMLEHDGARWVRRAPSVVTTSSNAVDLEVAFDGLRPRVAAAMRGRVDDRVPCQPGVRCKCPRDEDCAEDGACAMASQRIELFEIVPDLDSTALVDQIRCTCADPQGVGFCEPPPPRLCGAPTGRIEEDDCARPIMARIPAGPIQSPVEPRGLAVGPLRGPMSRDFVVATPNLVNFVEGDAWRYDLALGISLNQGHDDVLVASLDPRLDGTEDRPDLLWWSRSPCAGFDCPIEGEVEDSAGCLGVLLTAGSVTEDGLEQPRLLRRVPRSDPTHCRRIPLQEVPESVCVADFNGDGFEDVGLVRAGDGRFEVRVGDGFGALDAVPERFEMPGLTEGGPLFCGDVDGDGRADAVAVGRRNGVFAVLRSSP